MTVLKSLLNSDYGKMILSLPDPNTISSFETLIAKFSSITCYSAYWARLSLWHYFWLKEWMRVFKFSLLSSGPKILRSGSASPNLNLVGLSLWYHTTSMVHSYWPSGILSLIGARSCFHMFFCFYKITFWRLASLVLFMNLCINNSSYPLSWISSYSLADSMKRSKDATSLAKGLVSCTY